MSGTNKLVKDLPGGPALTEWSVPLSLILGALKTAEGSEEFAVALPPKIPTLLLSQFLYLLTA